MKKTYGLSFVSPTTVTAIHSYVEQHYYGISLFDVKTDARIIVPLDTYNCFDFQGDIVAIHENRIAVVFPYEKIIKFFDIQSEKINQTKGEDIRVDTSCWALDFKNRMLFASTQQPAAVLLMDNKKDTSVKFCINDGNYNRKLVYNSSRNVIYFDGLFGRQLVAMTLEGEVISVVRGIPSISDMVVDELDHLYVACRDGVYQLDTDTGQASQISDLKEPGCIAYNKYQNELYAAYLNELCVYSI